MPVLRVKSLILVFLLTGMAAQAEDPGLVQRALANEARAANDAQHLMRYRLRKSSPRLTTTKEICETTDGAVARLIAVNDAPLSAADEQREQMRLDQLLNDPGRQRHRKQGQDQDTARAMKVLRSLPRAFVYEYAGVGPGPSGQVAKFRFRPNPRFDPPDLETQVLKQMTGELWIDPRQERVAKLDGRLQQDVDIGWGILGRLYKGGTIVIDQADVGEGQWRIVHFDMKMSARVVFKIRVFDTTEDESQFVPVPAGLRYQQAIALLRDTRTSSTRNRSEFAGK
ncbi:MAG TPA: hypothetical protein VN753_11795 [Terracidiphilus sp.]|nr:hypothetical protein [Terracidiphilus sp.]